MSRLETDIKGQPEALERFLREGPAEVKAAARAMRDRRPRLLYVVARGSSENAARYAQYVLGERARIPVCLGNPSLFTRYSGHPDLRGAVACAISQSGGSPDTREVLEKARGQGCLTLAITNEPGSPLAGAADIVIAIRAREGSLAATQTYTNSVAALSFIAALLTGDRTAVEELRSAPTAMEAALGLSTGLDEVARAWGARDRAFVLGRGYNYGTAHEVALKLKELPYILAHPYSSAEFMHGPIAVVERGFPVVLFAPSGAVSAGLHALVERLAGAGADLLIVSDDRGLAVPKARFQEVPPCPEWISPLVCSTPGQLLALRLCETRGIDPDSPRGLEKVTRTM